RQKNQERDHVRGASHGALPSNSGASARRARVAGFRGVDVEAEVAEEGVARGFAAEEVADQVQRVAAAAFCEDLAAVTLAERGVEQALLAKRLEHVLRVHERPE